MGNSVYPGDETTQYSDSKTYNKKKKMNIVFHSNLEIKVKEKWRNTQLYALNNGYLKLKGKNVETIINLKIYNTSSYHYDPKEKCHQIHLKSKNETILFRKSSDFHNEISKLMTVIVEIQKRVNKIVETSVKVNKEYIFVEKEKEGQTKKKCECEFLLKDLTENGITRFECDREMLVGVFEKGKFDHNAVFVAYFSCINSILTARVFCLEMFIKKVKWNKYENILSIKGPVYDTRQYKCDELFLIHTNMKALIDIAKDAMTDHGNYNYFANNCRHFAKTYFKKIKKECNAINVGVSSDIVVKYINKYGIKTQIEKTVNTFDEKKQNYPFQRTSTCNGPTLKRAQTLSFIEVLKKYPLDEPISKISNDTYNDSSNSNTTDEKRENEVMLFLREIKLETYWKNFEKEGYEEMDDLVDITDDDLKCIGVDKQAYRKRILRKLKVKHEVSEGEDTVYI